MKMGVQRYSFLACSPAKPGEETHHGPRSTFCPNLVCAARGQTGQGNIGIHSRKEQRFICTACRKTFTATKGTALYRLRTAAETVSLVVTLMAHGCPLQAIVVAFGFDERTVAAWWARSGKQGQAVQECLVEPPRDLGHVQGLCRKFCSGWHERAGGPCRCGDYAARA